MAHDPATDLAALHARLDDVDAALGRLDDETYGQCRTCGEPIADPLLTDDPLRLSCPTCAG